MTSVAKLDLTIVKGKTFQQVLRWGADPIAYKTITAITNAAPVSITCTGHGIPQGWMVAVQSVKGMTQINSEYDPPRCNDYHQATVVDANTITFNDVNSLDYKAYTSGGVLRFSTPVDLTGYTARMKIKDAVGGNTIVSLTTENDGIVLNNTTKTITIEIDAVTTASMTIQRGVYDLEMVSGDVVTALVTGKVLVLDEVTT
jgi:uncharacterized protein YqkB